MNNGKGFDSFKFYNQGIFNEKISIKIADFDLLIKNVKSFFSLKSYSIILKFNGQGIAINRFQETAAERPVDFHGTPNDLFGEGIGSAIALSHPVNHLKKFR